MDTVTSGKSSFGALGFENAKKKKKKKRENMNTSTPEAFFAATSLVNRFSTKP